MNSHKSKLPVRDVDNPDEAMRGFKQRQQAIIDGLIELGLEYANKVTGKFISPESETYFTLRESIYYRLGGMLLHLDLLLAIQSNHQKMLAKDPFNQRGRITLLDSGSQQQLLIFDSVIFHAISLFDYLGNLIDYICGTKRQMGLKWNGVLDSVRDSKNQMSNSPIASVVLELHNDFVDRLYRHRSDLIHYRSDKAAATTTIKPMTSETNFSVFAPKRLTSLFPELSTLAETNRITLRFVAFWTCEKSLAATSLIITPLFKHIEINRKTPPGFAIFLKGPPNKPST
jgi:hypothetical protein